ncbi:hypothetical protein AX17_007492 [Amanita inopinata Kibby_2008]|nr:hypothetical protein AX17_007492 [Amanita inopinata Kibby_2008]
MSVVKQDTRALSLLTALWIVGPFALYILIVAFTLTPVVQTYTLFAHHIHFFGYTFHEPEIHGLAPGKTINFRLRSADNTSIGAWFLFSDAFYRTLPFPPPTRAAGSSPPSQTKHVPAALASSPTVLYLHGNTGTRAHELRINVYKGMTSRLGVNVLAIDYRGFGDSDGHPTVQGVRMDARAAWDYLIEQGARPQDILIVGHSLGTAVAGLLAAELGREGIEPRGTILMSPFSSLRTLMDEYLLFGFLPLLKPLAKVPIASQLVTWSLIHNFDTLSLVSHITSSVLIIHAKDDWDIPHGHSSVLFNALIEPYFTTSVPPPTAALAQADLGISIASIQKNITLENLHIPHFGVLESLTADRRKIVMLKTEAGGHDIGRVEGVQEVLGRTFGII